MSALSGVQVYACIEHMILEAYFECTLAEVRQQRIWQQPFDHPCSAVGTRHLPFAGQLSDLRELVTSGAEVWQQRNVWHHPVDHPAAWGQPHSASQQQPVPYSSGRAAADLRRGSHGS